MAMAPETTTPTLKNYLDTIIAARAAECAGNLSTAAEYWNDAVNIAYSWRKICKAKGQYVTAEAWAGAARLCGDWGLCCADPDRSCEDCGGTKVHQRGVRWVRQGAGS